MFTTSCRAYKLGKKRWSYNQVELRLTDVSGELQAHVKQTAHAADVDFPEPAQASCLVQAALCAVGRTHACPGTPRPVLPQCARTRNAPPCWQAACRPRIRTSGRDPLTRQPLHLPRYPQDSAVCFHVQLESGHKLRVHLFVVYDRLPPEAASDPQQQQQQDRQPADQRHSW